MVEDLVFPAVVVEVQVVDAQIQLVDLVYLHWDLVGPAEEEEGLVVLEAEVEEVVVLAEDLVVGQVFERVQLVLGWFLELPEREQMLRTG